MSLPVVLAAVVALSAVAVRASDRNKGPFKPVIARQTLTYVSEDTGGARRILSQFTGTYLRSSRGSELATLGLVVNGQEGKPSEGRLRLAKDGTTYKLDYVKKTATLVAVQSVPLMPHTYEAIDKSEIEGHETINGHRCVAMAVKNRGDKTGTAWRDTKEDVLVRLISFFGSEEDHVRIILERSDINTHEEPDESLFALPGKWTVITPANVVNQQIPAKSEPQKEKPEGGSKQRPAKNESPN